METRNPKKYYFQICSDRPDDVTQLQMADSSWYSMTPWKEANFISRIIQNFYIGTRAQLSPRYYDQPIITDATANVGGNTISFYLTGSLSSPKINSVEIDKETADMLKHNLTCYHLPTDRVHCCDYLSIYRHLHQDVVFIDPPWGGHNYDHSETLELSLGDVNLNDLCATLLHEKLASLVVLKVPINFVSRRLPDYSYLVQKIYRGTHHSYNVIFIWR